MPRASNAALLAAFALTLAPAAGAVASAELYTTQAYRYGRFEARLQFPPGDGVIGSFFLWKSGSEQSGVYWNELDFEKIRAECTLQLNSLHGLPVSGHESLPSGLVDLCTGYHTYSYEWTPDYIAWAVDGVELRRDVGAEAQAYVDNASQGMQIHFNVWPGTAAFGGNFSPATLPAHQYIAWVRYSAFTPGAGANGSDFSEAWAESFDRGIPSGWQLGSWVSPLQQSTHASANVRAVNGVAVLSLTADDAQGFSGEPPLDDADVPASEPPPAEPPVVTPLPAPTQPSASSGCQLARHGDTHAALALLVSWGLLSALRRRPAAKQ